MFKLMPKSTWGLRVMVSAIFKSLSKVVWLFEAMVLIVFTRTQTSVLYYHNESFGNKQIFSCLFITSKFGIEV